MAEKLRGAQEDRGSVWRMAAITSLRGLARGVPVPLAVALALSACAPARGPALQPQAIGAAAPAPVARAYATVAAVRPIGKYGSAGSDPDAAILPAMGLAASATARSGLMSEIVVRTDGGETLSVVQPSALALVPGERVILLPGGSGRRLVPAPPQS